jgi:hypothetical protein
VVRVDEPQVKGLAFKGILNALQRMHGPHAVERVREQLPSVARLIVSGNWYPISTYKRLLSTVVETLGGAPAAIRAVSREATLDDFRGIYRVLTFVLSPESLMKRAPGVFNRYYDTGTLAILDARDGMVRAQYSGCTGFDHLMWEDVTGGSVAILEACGARDIQVRTLSGGTDKDDHLLIDATWK